MMSRLQLRFESSDNCDNLPNYLGIAIPELISPVDSARIRVNDQTAVLAAAAPAQVGPVTFENDIQRLLP